MTDPFFSNKLRRQQHPQQQVEGPEFTVTLLRRVISTSLVTKLFNKVLIYIHAQVFCYKVGTGAYIGQHYIWQPSQKGQFTNYVYRHGKPILDWPRNWQPIVNFANSQFLGQSRMVFPCLYISCQCSY